MATTRDFRKRLKGEIHPHTDENGRPLEGTVTPTGLIKTKKGLIIPPSQFNDQSSHSGPIVPLTAEEQALFPQTGGQVGGVLNDTKPSGTAPRKRAARPRKAAAPTTVTVGVILGSAGKIPSQYTHVYRGNGILVLGMCDLSYEPKRVTIGKDNAYEGLFELEQYPGERYGYLGNEFKDGDGVRNLLVFRLPDSKERKHDDGQKKQ